MGLDQERVEARERVRQAQEREARAWQAAHRPLMERATRAVRWRGDAGRGGVRVRV